MQMLRNYTEITFVFKDKKKIYIHLGKNISIDNLDYCDPNA